MDFTYGPGTGNQITHKNWNIQEQISTAHQLASCDVIPKGVQLSYVVVITSPSSIQHNITEISEDSENHKQGYWTPHSVAQQGSKK